MLAVLTSVLYVSMGLGIVRLKVANNLRLRRQWYRIHPAAKLLTVLLEPPMAVVRGWETVVLVLYAAVTGAALELQPEPDDE